MILRCLLIADYQTILTMAVVFLHLDTFKSNILCGYLSIAKGAGKSNHIKHHPRHVRSHVVPNLLIS